MKIYSVVSFYHPSLEEIENVINFIKKLPRIYIVDDSEEDNSAIFDKADKNKYEYIRSGGDKGLATAMNIGITHALNDGAEWILLLNSDTQLINNIIKVFNSYICSNDTTCVAALATQCYYDRHRIKPYKGSKKLKWANMTGTLINSQLINKIGLFEEKLFIDGLDVEWCIRARKLGYYIIELGEAVIKHKPAMTKEAKMGKRTLFFYGWAPPERYYYQFRSYWYILKKYKSFEALKWLLIKVSKVILLFDNKRIYLKYFIQSLKDVNNEVWGNFE